MGKLRNIAHSTPMHVVAGFTASAATLGVALAVGHLWKRNAQYFLETGSALALVSGALTFSGLYIMLGDDDSETPPVKKPGRAKFKGKAISSTSEAPLSSSSYSDETSSSSSSTEGPAPITVKKIDALIKAQGSTSSSHEASSESEKSEQSTPKGSTEDDPDLQAALALSLKESQMKKKAKEETEEPRESYKVPKAVEKHAKHEGPLPPKALSEEEARRAAMREKRLKRFEQGIIPTASTSKTDPEATPPPDKAPPKPKPTKPAASRVVFRKGKKLRAAGSPELKVKYSTGTSLSGVVKGHVLNAEDVSAHRGILTADLAIAEPLSELTLVAEKVVLCARSAPSEKQLAFACKLADTCPVSLCCEETYHIDLSRSPELLKAKQLEFQGPVAIGGLSETVCPRALAGLVKRCPSLKALTLQAGQGFFIPQLYNLSSLPQRLQFVGKTPPESEVKRWVRQGFLDGTHMDLSGCSELSQRHIETLSKAREASLSLPPTTNIATLRVASPAHVMSLYGGLPGDDRLEHYSGPNHYSPLLSRDGRVHLQPGTRVIDPMTAALILRWKGVDRERRYSDLANRDQVEAIHFDDHPLLTHNDLLSLKNWFPKLERISARRCPLLKIEGDYTRFQEAIGWTEGEFIPIDREAAGGSDLVKRDAPPCDASEMAKQLIACYTHAKELFPEIRRQCLDSLCLCITSDNFVTIAEFAVKERIGPLLCACHLFAKALGMEFSAPVTKKGKEKGDAFDPMSQEFSDCCLTLNGRQRHLHKWTLMVSIDFYRFFQPEGEAYASGEYELLEGKACEFFSKESERLDYESFCRVIEHLLDYLEGHLDLSEASDRDVKTLLGFAGRHNLEGLSNRCAQQLGYTDIAAYRHAMVNPPTATAAGLSLPLDLLGLLETGGFGS